MKTFLLFLSILSSSFVFSQSSPLIRWQQALGLGNNVLDEVNALQPTADSGWIVAGTTNYNDGTNNYDYFVVKLTSTGAVQWQKRYGGSGDDEAYAVQPAKDGGYVVAGWSSSTDKDVTGNHGLLDVWVLKLTATGSIQWQKSFGGSKADGAYSMQATADGGDIIAGFTQSSDGDATSAHSGGNDYWIIKIDSTGNLKWQKSFGGSLQDFASDIQVTPDSGYIVTGTCYSSDGDVTGHHQGSFVNDDFWVLKLNNAGNLQWQKSFGGTDNDFANSIAVVPTGGYVIAGSTYSTDGDIVGDNIPKNGSTNDEWIVKIDNLGNLQWQKTLGGSSYDQSTSIVPTVDGGYVETGYSQSTDGDVTGGHGGYDYWVVKLSGLGAIQWEKSFGGTNTDVANVIRVSRDSSYVIGGWTVSTDGDVVNNQPPNGQAYFWIIKTTKDEILPVNLISFNAAFENKAVTLEWQTAQEINADYFIVQKSIDAVHFNDLSKVMAVGNTNIMQNYSAIDNQPLTSTTFYRLKQVDKDGGVSFSKIVSLTPINIEKLAISPNPAPNSLNIQLQNASAGKATIEVVAISGKTFITQTANLTQGINTLSVSVSVLPKGTYILKIFSGKTVEARKFVKD